ncbi:MAG: tRNA (adenosine(37)-N6)-threonylcarbamoyltransferase complex dimerization subunit type 1 TsaB [Bacteroidota bacterium]
MKQAKAEGPFILAIETATMIGSVAVFEGEKLLGSIDMRRAKSHARLLTPMIQTLLKDLEIEPQALSAVAVAKGPGSYTGLRVGVSTAKGLCYALDKPLLSLGSLEGLAWSVQSLAHSLDALICPLIDARRMEVYCAAYDQQGREEVPVQAVIVEEGSFGELLDKQKVIFVGDGAEKCQPLLSHPNAIVLPDVLSSAASMGKALCKKYAEDDFEDLIHFEPFYLKDFVATKSKKWQWNLGAR